MYSGVLCLQKKIVLKMKILEPKILMAHVFPHFSHGGSNSCSVLIAYLGKTSFVLTKQKTDGGRLVILDITLDSDQFILINLGNPNTETEQVEVLKELQSCRCYQNEWIIFAGDFDIIFNLKLEAKDDKPLLKRNSIAKLVEIKESLDICDIRRIINHEP